MTELFQRLSTLLDQPQPDTTQVALLLMALQGHLKDDLVISDAEWMQIRGNARVAGLSGMVMLLATSLGKHLQK